MLDHELHHLCKKLKPIMGRKADTLWLAYLSAESPQAKHEAQALIQILAAKHLSQSVDDVKILLPPPAPAAAQGEFYLGTILYGNKPLYPLGLERENFIKHIGVFGITGSGKTVAAQNLLMQLLEARIPFLCVDWKRSYRDLRSLKRPDVQRIEIYSVGRKTGSPFHWNPLRGPPGVDPRTWISIVAESLERSHVAGQGVADVFIELFDKKFAELGVYDGTFDKWPNFFDAMEEIQRVQFRGRRQLWQDSCTRILRTFTFGPAAGAFNARHGTRIEELLEKPVVIELDQELPKPLRVFFSEIILRWIHLFRLSQGETDLLRHVTLLEEVHNLFPRTSAERQASNSLENVFREIRGFAEGLIVVTQHPSVVPIEILGNVNTQVYLGLQHEDDIVTAKRALFLNKGEEVFLDRLSVGEGIVKIKGRVEPCHVKFPLLPTTKGGVTDDMLAGDTHH